jgi:hypothetical protein
MDSPRGEPIFDGGMTADSWRVPAAVDEGFFRYSYEWRGLLEFSSPAPFRDSRKEDFPCGAEAMIPVLHSCHRVEIQEWFFRLLGSCAAIEETNSPPLGITEGKGASRVPVRSDID